MAVVLAVVDDISTKSTTLTTVANYTFNVTGNNTLFNLQGQSSDNQLVPDTFVLYNLTSVTGVVVNPNNYTLDPEAMTVYMKYGAVIGNGTWKWMSAKYNWKYDTYTDNSTIRTLYTIFPVMIAVVILLAVVGVIAFKRG